MSDSQPKPIRTVLAVDVSHLFWTSALGRSATPNNPRDHVLRTVRALAVNYDRVAIAVDGQKLSFRAKLWPGYKAKRKERPEQLWALLGDTARHLSAAGFHVFEAPEVEEGYTYEADDVIGSLAQWCVERGIKVDILSGDSDLAQLVDDTNGVRLLRNYQGIHALNAEGVRKWLNVYPGSVVELKALAGDSGDGYGDVFPGIGDDTAIELLSVSEWSARKGVEKVIETVKEYRAKIDAGEKVPQKHAPSKKRLTIAELGLERLEIAYALAAVCRDVPLDFGTLETAKTPENLPELGSRMLPDDPPPGAQPPDSEPSADDASDAELVPAESVPALPGSAIVTVDPTARMLISPAEAKQRLREFTAMIRTVLVPNVDYGKIPGCGDKDVLAKSGAEKLAEVYGFAASFKIETRQENWSEDDPLFYYLVRCTLRRKSDRAFVGDCLGSCNSKEKKYAARWVFEREVPAHLDKSRLKTRVYNGDRGPFTKYRVPNEEIFDLVNTILKMAEKRAFVGAVLIATRASGQFSADLDDMLESFGNVSQRPQWEQSSG